MGESQSAGWSAEDYRVEVSRRIREEFENGRHYYALHGQSLAVLPRHEGSRPAPEFLEWHHGIFKGWSPCDITQYWSS